MHDLISVWQEWGANGVLLVLMTTGFAGFTIFVRYTQGQISGRITDLRREHRQIKDELKRTIKMLTLYHDDCIRERQDLQKTILRLQAAREPDCD